MLVISENFDGLANAQIYFDYIEDYVESMYDPLHAIGEVVRSQIKDVFHENMGAAAGGGSWTPLRPSYHGSKEKRFSAFPDNILMLTGQLYLDATDASIIDVDGDELSVSIDNELAEIHHEGEGRMPPRPLWEDNPYFRARAEEITTEWLRDIGHYAPPSPGRPEFEHRDITESEAGHRYYSRRSRSGQFIKRPRYYN